MKSRLIIILALVFIFLIKGYTQTGFRGGINLSSNMEEGEGPILGWHAAGYLDLETYKTISYRIELKCSRIGYKNSETTLVSLWYASFPLLLNFNMNSYNKSSIIKKNSLFFGVEPGLYIIGHEIPIERMRSLDYIFLKNHKESYSRPTVFRQDFNIEGVLGYKFDSKFDIYVFFNIGFINPDMYLTLSVGI